MADITETIRDRIETIIQGVDATATVYKFPIALESEADFLAAFGTGVNADDEVEIAKGWAMMLRTITTTRQGAKSGPEIDEYVALLECHWSEYDNGLSEVAFTAHVNAVRQALTNNFSLSGTATLKAGPAQVLDLGYRRWGKRLSHSAVVSYPVKVTVIRSVT